MNRVVKTGEKIMNPKNFTFSFMGRVKITLTLSSIALFGVHWLADAIPDFCQSAEVVVNRWSILFTCCQWIAKLLKTSSTFHWKPLFDNIPQILCYLASVYWRPKFWFNGLFYPSHQKMVVSNPVFKVWGICRRFRNAPIYEAKFLARAQCHAQSNCPLIIIRTVKQRRWNHSTWIVTWCEIVWWDSSSFRFNSCFNHCYTAEVVCREKIGFIKEKKQRKRLSGSVFVNEEQRRLKKIRLVNSNKKLDQDSYTMTSYELVNINLTSHNHDYKVYIHLSRYLPKPDTIMLSRYNRKCRYIRIYGDHISIKLTSKRVYLIVEFCF